MTAILRLRISILVGALTLSPLANAGRDSVYPLVQQNQFEQCVFEICGNSWEGQAKVYEQLQHSKESLPSPIKDLIRQNIESIFTFALSLDEQFFVPPELDASKDKMSDLQVKWLGIMATMKSFPEDATMGFRGVNYDAESVSKKYADFPQIDDAIYRLAFFPAFIEYLEYFDRYRGNGLLYIDSLYIDRKVGMKRMQKIAANLVQEIENFKHDQAIYSLLSSRFDAEFWYVLHQGSHIPYDIDVFIKNILHMTLLLNLLQDKKLTEIFQGVSYADSYDEPKALQGFDYAKFYKKYLTAELLASRNSFVNLPPQDGRVLQEKIIEDVSKLMKIYYQARPTRVDEMRFREMTKDVLSEVSEAVGKYYSKSFSAIVSTYLKEIEFATSVPQSVVLARLQKDSKNLQDRLEAYGGWRQDSFIHYMALSSFLYKDKYFETLIEDFFDIDKYDVPDQFVEFSALYGPLILTGWQVYKLGAKYKSILYHEVAHKLSHLVQRQAQNLPKSDVEKFKHTAQCLQKLHPEEKDYDEFFESKLLDVKKGFYFEEDFADGFAAVVSQDKSRSQNLACFFIEGGPEMPPIDLLAPEGDPHSSLFFRLLHFELVRKKSLPPSCRHYLNSYHNDREFVDCFASHR